MACFLAAVHFVRPDLAVATHEDSSMKMELARGTEGLNPWIPLILQLEEKFPINQRKGTNQNDWLIIDYFFSILVISAKSGMVSISH